MSSAKTFHELQIRARDVQDIEKWIVDNSVSTIKQKTKHAWLKRFFKQVTIDKLELVNVNYYAVEPSWDSITDNELWNVRGYSCSLVYKLSHKGVPAMTLDHFPDIHCKNRCQTQALIGATYKQELFLPARSWPFITVHLVYDWLYNPSFKEARHSESYSLDYGGLHSFLALYPRTVDSERIGPTVQKMYEEVFTQLPWQSLLDLHAAGVLPADKVTFTEWLCPYVIPQATVKDLVIDIPSDIAFE